MRGDRIVNTPYTFHMRKNEQCLTLCSNKLTKEDVALFKERIRQEYSAHMIVDNLPVATVINPQKMGDIYYDLGYRLGWIDDTGKTLINNHLQFVVKYHKHSEGLYR